MHGREGPAALRRDRLWKGLIDRGPSPELLACHRQAGQQQEIGAANADVRKAQVEEYLLPCGWESGEHGVEGDENRQPADDQPSSHG